MKKQVFSAIFLFLLTHVSLWSQIGGDYNPDSPSDPDAPTLKYLLNIKAFPEEGGSFNISKERVAADFSTGLYAYPRTDYTFSCWMIGDSVLSTDNPLDFTMPAHDVTIIGKFEYNPTNPANPASNHWNSETGEVIIDDFTPGNVSNAIYDVINKSESSYSEVTSIIVAGQINSYDFSVANYYENCTLLDLSRASGVTEVPSWAFDYSNLESIYLPYTIEKIGYAAFSDCSNLISVTCYSMTPPVLDGDVFSGVPEGLVVYVPAAAIPQYQETDGWKDFTILPIQEDIRKISVSLPNGTNTADFAQMWLELTNTKSGQRMHYVMTDRTTYIFQNIIRNTSWNIVLRNERGDVFGKIDNVEVKDEDVSVIFSNLSKPQNLELSVLSPDGKDVTDQIQITWIDIDGNYLSQSSKLSGLPVGFTTNYRISLSQELAMLYDTPSVGTYTLKNGNNQVVCRLAKISNVTLSGIVKDASTNMPLSGATISASQTFGGKYSKTVNTTAASNGQYTLTLPNVPTTLAIAATDYVSQTLVCDSLMYGNTSVNVPTISLKEISGAVLSIGLTYTACSTGNDDENDFQEWYSDYNNISYSIYNKTKRRNISQFNVQYPQIVLLETVDDGDVLELTATSRVSAFMPITSSTIIQNQKADIVFNIVELGKIQASFSKNSNASVVGSLYDDKGKLVKTYNYTNAKLTIEDLADGNYTLVTMGSSTFFNTIYDLAKLPQTGLSRGVDYVQSSVEVKSGNICSIDIAEVPTLNESKLYYTGNNTSFTVNKQSIVVGNYLTLTGHIDFKPAYATIVSNVQMVVDLPESCQFVENSVMVGNSTSSYTINGNRITIPLTQYTDRVRFCVIPTLGGDYAPSAFAQFDLNGKTVTQPIGSANYAAKDLSISVPSIVAKTSVPISGTAIGTSTIDIYDNDVLIGQTTSLANGTWATTCELNEPYNLSKHNIYAKVTTKQGIELQSEAKDLIYDVNAIQIQKVTMFHYNPEMNKIFESVFDFQNPSSKPNQWTVYYPKKQFTYTIDFTNNSPEKVTNVVLYIHAADGQIVPLSPTYDEGKDIWVANIDMGSRSDNYYPVNVSVDFDFINEKLIDTKELSNASNDYFCLSREFEESTDNFDKWLSSNDSTDEIDNIENTGNNDWASVIDEKIKELTGLSVDDDNDNSYMYFSNMTDEELDSYLSHLQESDLDIELANMESSIDSIMHIMSSKLDEIQELGDGTKISMSTCEGLNSESLIEKGFTFIPSTNGSGVYVLVSESTSEFVDFDNNQYTLIQYSALLTDFARSSFRAKSRLDEFNEIMDRINGLYQPIANAWNETNKKLYNFVENFKNAYVAKSFDFGSKKAVYNSKLVKLSRLKNELKSLNSLSLEYHIKLGEIQSYQKEVKAAKKLMDNAGRLKAIAGVAYKSVKLLPSFFAKKLPLAKYADAIYTFLSVARRYQKVYLSIPDPCKDDQAKAESLQSDCVKEGWATEGVAAIKLGTTAVLDLVTFGAVATAAETGGVSLLAAAGTAILNILANLIFDNAFYEQVEKSINAIITERNQLECVKKCGTNGYPPCPDNGGGSGNPGGGNGGSGGNGGGGSTGSGSPNDNVEIDPSGYVYESVFSNRLEGVTATAYYKEMVEDMYGDLSENIVKWDAEEYAQENPLFTDENGYYRWDVPQGLWQVKFEKEGYETTYSEWLPVPPPQLDINIAMKQNVQPNVKNARAYGDAVEVEFDKYMMPEYLTTDNIVVMCNNNVVEGTVVLLNEEVSYEGASETFASKVRFNAAEPFDAKEVTLIVNNRVRSYAGIRMQDNFSQTFDVELEAKEIVCDANTILTYGENGTLAVRVLPASAAVGKTLYVKTSSPMILGVDEESVSLDNQGQAIITITGNLPGTAALTFSLEGYDLSATTIVNIEQKSAMTVANPTANIASGSIVERGTAIYLSCETEGATIYYTLDGSCPCDESSSRKIYDGTPIIINDNVNIKVWAIAPDMYESDVIILHYVVEGGNAIDVIALNGKINIYPLPVRDKLTISTEEHLIKKVTLNNVNGSTLIENHDMAKSVTLDVSHLPTGIYIINIVIDDKLYSKKIIKAM